MENELIRRAREAQKHAYCPYSQFPVGAALTDERGTVHPGCNVENASYGLTVCAERNAIGHMVAHGGREWRHLVLVSPTEAPITPCGACRQVLLEFAHPQARVTLVPKGGEPLTLPFSELMPQPFSLEHP